MLPIVAQHPDFVIVHKPAGEDFHSGAAGIGFFARLEQVLDEKLWPVHRLDKVTSGILLCARSQDAARTLNRLFAEQQIRKTYLALAPGKPKKKQGEIKGGMVAARRGAWRLTRATDNLAITRFQSFAVEPGMRGYYLQPKTGKTHQLRVAMKSLGVPILGDSLYAGSPADRTYLHAYRLAFQYQEQAYSFTCLPDNGELFISEPFLQALKSYESTLV